jgi:hypothetical protein
MADDKNISIIREQGEFFEPVELTPDEQKPVAAESTNRSGDDD